MNPQFKEFLAKKEDATYDVQGVYDEYINTLSKIEMWEMEEFNELVKAYKKDRNSTLGFARKINKYGSK